jgi:hypothetical protein
VVDVEIKETPVRFLEFVVHRGSKRGVDAVEDTLEFNAGVEP